MALANGIELAFGFTNLIRRHGRTLRFLASEGALAAQFFPVRTAVAHETGRRRHLGPRAAAEQGRERILAGSLLRLRRTSRDGTAHA